MMQENGHIEIFERYRNGDLMEAELREFEARLAYDSEFKEAFDAYEQLELGINAHFRNDLKLKLKMFDEKMDAPTSKKTSIKKLLIWSSSIAASILIGVILFQHFSSNSSVQLAEQYWPEERGLPVKMSSRGKYDDAMNAFKLEEWDKAEGMLKEIDSDTAHYFLGVIAFEKKDYKKASWNFKQIESNSDYYQIAQFRLALVCLIGDKIDLSKIILKELIESNTLFSRDAKEILKKI